MEVGSFKGRSTLCAALGARQTGAKCYGVDPHPQWVADQFNKGIRTEAEFKANIKAFGFEDTIIPVVERSEDYEKTWSKPIKLLFIDGEHTYEAVMKDQAWLKHVTPGGIVLYDDVGGGVLQAMQEGIMRNPDFYACEDIFIRRGPEWWL